MSADQPLTLTVNGRARAVRAAPADTLLEVLRDQLGLTGAKRGCNQGVCGACTVLLDGRPVRGCLSLALNCDGRRLRTIEGLAQRPALQALQQRVRRARRGAMRLLHAGHAGRRARRCCEANPQPRSSRDARRAVRQSLPLLGLSQDRRRRACRAARGERRHERAPTARRSAVEPCRRLEAREKVTGSAQYIADLYRARHAAWRDPAEPARPCAHPRLRHRARRWRCPACARVVTGDDSATHRMGAFIKDEPALAKGKVRYVGEPVAAVAADTEAHRARRRAADRGRLRGAAGGARPGRGAGAGRAARPRGHRRLFPASFDAGTRRQSLPRAPASRKATSMRAWARLRRRSSKASYQTQAQAHCRDRAVRRAGRDRRRRPRHAVVGEPVGLPRPGQCLRSRSACRCRGCAA